MAGTFISQSKVRPGAYVTFKSVANETINPGTRGIVAVPLTLSWGDTNNLIEVTAGQYLNGQIYEKLGVNAGSEAAIPLREIFKNAASALVYRLNADGQKAEAEATISTTPITITAKHAGTLGNRISVSCELNSTTNVNELITTVDGLVVERQAVTNLSAFIPNAWIDVTTASQNNLVFTPFTAVTLTGGTDGSAVADGGVAQYTAFMNKCSDAIWNTMVVPNTNSTVLSNVAEYVKGLREEYGKKVQAVVCEYTAANHEGIISVSQGYYIGNEVVSVANFAAYVAGMTAGASITESNTYKVIAGATGIFNPLSHSEIELGLRQGKLMLSMRQDRSVVIEKDINTLHTFTADKSYIFSKNRVLRCLDDIATQVTILFENGFIGKVNNDESGRTLFRGAVIGYLNELQARGAIQNFDANTDVTVTAGSDIESVVCGVAVQPIDSMEKLYLTVVIS